MEVDKLIQVTLTRSEVNRILVEYITKDLGLNKSDTSGFSVMYNIDARSVISGDENIIESNLIGVKLQKRDTR